MPFELLILPTAPCHPGCQRQPALPGSSRIMQMILAHFEETGFIGPMHDENWKVRLIEEAFMKHMWDVEGAV